MKNFSVFLNVCLASVAVSGYRIVDGDASEYNDYCVSANNPNEYVFYEKPLIDDPRPADSIVFCTQIKDDVYQCSQLVKDINPEGIQKNTVSCKHTAANVLYKN